MLMSCLCLGLVAYADEASVFDMDEPAPAPAAAPASAAPPAPSGDTARDVDSGTGSLAASLISDVMKKNQWAIQDCAARLGGAGFAGRMVVEWEILDTGRVANAKITESNLRNPPVETCIVSSLKRLRFAAPTGGTVIVAFPFVFQQ